MKKVKVQIRRGVFETNSSSSHSLTMAPGDLAAAPFSEDVLRGGLLELAAGEYGFEWRRFYGAEQKLRYLLTQVTGGQVSASCLEDNERVQMLAAVVRDFTGCELQVRHSSGYVDHQSAEGERGVGLELFEDADRLKAFVFGPESFLQTGNDNCTCPWDIPTDRGVELAYKHRFRDVPEGFVPVKMSVLSDVTCNALGTAAGGLIRDDVETDLFTKVASGGIVTFAEWRTAGSYNFLATEDVRGYTAAFLSVTEDGMGFGLSPTMLAVNHWTKRSSDAPDEQVLELVVQLPQALAEELAQLDTKGARQWVVGERLRKYKLWAALAKGKRADSWEGRRLEELRQAVLKAGGKKELAKLDAEKTVKAKARPRASRKQAASQ